MRGFSEESLELSRDEVRDLLRQIVPARQCTAAHILRTHAATSARGSKHLPDDAVRAPKARAARWFNLRPPSSTSRRHIDSRSGRDNPHRAVDGRRIR